MMMIKSPKIWPLLLLGVTLIALIFLSAGLSHLDLLPGQPFPFSGLNRTPANGSAGGIGPAGWPTFLASWWGILAISFFGLLLLLWVITFILRPQARKRLLSRLASYIGLLLLISWLIFALQQRIEQAPLEETNPLEMAPSELGELTEEDMPTPPAFVVEPPAWLIFTMTAGFLTLILAGAWFLGRRWQQRPEAPADLVVKEAQQAIQALQAGQDLKDTVMNCYLKMNQQLRQQQGIRREKGMTPREFETYLAELGFSNEHIRRLTRLFENVRYGATTASPQEEQEALACLRAIVEAYGRSPV